MTIHKTLMAALVATTMPTLGARTHETEQPTELFRPGAEMAAAKMPGADAAAAMQLASYGDIGFDIGSDVPEVRAAFGRGIAHLRGLNHTAAAAA